MEKINKYFLLLLLVSILSITLKAENYSPDKNTRSFKVKKGGELYVKIVSGNIYVSTWSKNVVKVTAKKNHYDNVLKALKFSKNGNRVNVKSSSYEMSVNLEIYVPVEFNLDINTMGGNLMVDGNLKGNINGKTAGGNIYLDKVDGNVRLKTAGGDIKSKAINGNADLHSAGGNFKIGYISGKANISTGGGNIFLAGVKSDLNLSTGGGNIRVETVESGVNVSTGGGNVSIGGLAKMVDISTGGGNVMVDGAKSSVTISSGAGNISVNDAKSWATVSTGSGNINLTLSTVNTNDTDLKTGAGNITLTLPSDVDATVTAVVKLDKWTIENKDTKDWITSDFPATTYNIVNVRGDNEIVAVYKLNKGKNKIFLRAAYGKILILKLKNK